MIGNDIIRTFCPICLLAGLVLASCEPELPGKVRFEDGTKDGTKSLTLEIGQDCWPATRSSLGDDVENLFSGAVLAVYDAGRGDPYRTGGPGREG